jgi:hypothetical protein
MRLITGKMPQNIRRETQDLAQGKGQMAESRRQKAAKDRNCLLPTASCLLRARGQALLEFAISLIGIVMFFYVLLKVWVWLDTMIIGRQTSFQQTRLAAGQQATAGTPVPYQRPPIRLVGTPGSTGGLPGDGVDLILGDPPCTAAEPFYAKAKQLFAESHSLQDLAHAKTLKAQQLSQKLAELTSQIHVVCSGKGKKKKCKVVGPFAEIDQTKAELDQTTAEAKALMNQALAKSNEANQQLQLGNEACD